MSRALLAADLHLTAVARDEYRWRLFPWLEEQIALYAVKALLLLGDLTEAKDYHSSRLVNRLVDALCRLEKVNPGLVVWLLPGNHDGLDPTCPYFRFLRNLPFCRYIEAPYMGPLAGRENVLFLPHTKEPEAWDVDLLQRAEVIFMHQTVSGAQAETGVSLEGMSAKALAGARRASIWSGDVHVPQKIGLVEYVGSPYPVRFGDSFKPRVVLLDKGLREAKSLEPPRFGRHSIVLNSSVALDKAELQSGDQIKVRVKLTRAEFVEWNRIRARVHQFCEETGVELCGLEVEKIEERVPRIPRRGEKAAAALSPAQILGTWCAKQKVDKPLEEAGQELLKSVAR